MTQADTPSPAQARSFFTPPVYDRLKFVAQIILPALGTLVFAFGGIWDWDFSLITKVVGSLTALDLFLGAVLQFSSSQFYKSGNNFDGTILVHDTPEKTTHTLELNKGPEDLINKQMVTFNVARVNVGKHEAPGE